MEIARGWLETFSEIEVFEGVFVGYVETALERAHLFPKLSLQRVHEAHGAWLNDLSRVGEHEPHLADGLDHFKQSGHLAFWLRRMSPLVEAEELGAPSPELDEKQQAFRELLYAYGNEYLAFDFGYLFCKFYESGSDRSDNLVLDEDYYRTMCHFLKYKTVSPHAMFLIYKSLFIH